MNILMDGSLKIGFFVAIGAIPVIEGKSHAGFYVPSKT